jgi:hypothetical protein
MPSLHPEYNYFTRETDRLNDLTLNIGSLQKFIHRQLVAEIIILRLHGILLNVIESVAEKIGSGASYFDGSSPCLLVTPRRSRFEAIKFFQNHGRTKPRKTLRWSVPKEINKNVKYVIAHNDNFCLNIKKHYDTIEDLRKIRNRIAHSNEKSRSEYRQIIRKYYGANLRNITPGTLLLTNQWSPCLLEGYILRSRVFVKELVKK